MKEWILRSDYFVEQLGHILLGDSLPFDVFIKDSGMRLALVKKGRQWGPRSIRVLALKWPEVEMPDGPIKQKIKMLYSEIMGIEIKRMGR